MNLKKVFNAMIDCIESHNTLESLGKSLYEMKLIRPSVHLGTGDTRKEMKEEITRADLDDTIFMKSMNISRIDLAEIYRTKHKKANMIFYLSLFTIGAFIGLIIFGLIIIFMEKKLINTAIIATVSSMMPGLIGGASFWVYRSEKNDLKPLENDIIKISKLVSFLEMTRFISDEEQKTKAYENIIGQMNRRENSPKKILILSANPEDTDRLRLDKEVREIEGGLDIAVHRDRFNIKSKWAVRFSDLRRALLKYKPHFVHFSGHGAENGLMVEGELGLAEPISSKAISGLFGLCSDHVECVILNACYSATQADIINKYIKYVIGMPSQIEDRASIEFSVGFYDALGAGKSIEEAFKFGCNAIEQKFPDLPEHLLPVLKKGLPS